MHITFLTGWILPYCTCCNGRFFLCILMLDVSALYVLLLDDIVFKVVAVLCMWLSYVYCHPICMCGLVMCSCCTDCIDVLHRCRAAGYKSVSGSSCDRPPRHRFFLVSLCLIANTEMVPKIPICHYILLM
jgi:hypothetical protein